VHCCRGISGKGAREYHEGWTGVLMLSIYDVATTIE